MRKGNPLQLNGRLEVSASRSRKTFCSATQLKIWHGRTPQFVDSAWRGAGEKQQVPGVWVSSLKGLANAFRSFLQALVAYGSRFLVFATFGALARGLVDGYWAIAQAVVGVGMLKEGVQAVFYSPAFDLLTTMNLLHSPRFWSMSLEQRSKNAQSNLSREC